MNAVIFFRTLIVCTLPCVSVFAQDATKEEPPSIPIVAQKTVDSVVPKTAVVKTTAVDPMVNETPMPSMQRELGEIAGRLAAIEKTVVRDPKPAEQSVVWTVIGSLAGILIGAVLGYFSQTKLAREKAVQDRELAESSARFEVHKFFFQWQLDQLSELYGPLRALLLQSSAIYRQMNLVLEKAAPEKFRLSKSGDDFDNRVFEINSGNGWERFRTILHIDEVYGKEFGIEEYFDEVVAIGERMVKIIEMKAGYARPDQPELLSVFGRYLAHYAILYRLHATAKEMLGNGDDVQTSIATRLRKMQVNESAVFPHEIQALVDKGFAAINGELNDWLDKAAKQ